MSGNGPKKLKPAPIAGKQSSKTTPKAIKLTSGNGPKRPPSKRG